MPTNPIRDLRIENLKAAFHDSPDLGTKLWALEEFLRLVRADLLAAKFSVRETRFPPPLPLPPEDIPGLRRGVDSFGERNP